MSVGHETLNRMEETRLAFSSQIRYSMSNIPDMARSAGTGVGNGQDYIILRYSFCVLFNVLIFSLLVPTQVPQLFSMHAHTFRKYK